MQTSMGVGYDRVKALLVNSRQDQLEGWQKAIAQFRQDAKAELRSNNECPSQGWLDGYLCNVISTLFSKANPAEKDALRTYILNKATRDLEAGSLESKHLTKFFDKILDPQKPIRTQSEKTLRQAYRYKECLEQKLAHFEPQLIEIQNQIRAEVNFDKLTQEIKELPLISWHRTVNEKFLISLQAIRMQLHSGNSVVSSMLILLSDEHRENAKEWIAGVARTPELKTCENVQKFFPLLRRDLSLLHDYFGLKSGIAQAEEKIASLEEKSIRQSYNFTFDHCSEFWQFSWGFLCLEQHEAEIQVSEAIARAAATPQRNWEISRRQPAAPVLWPH